MTTRRGASRSIESSGRSDSSANTGSSCASSTSIPRSAPGIACGVRISTFPRPARESTRSASSLLSVSTASRPQLPQNIRIRARGPETGANVRAGRRVLLSGCTARHRHLARLDTVALNAAITLVGPDSSRDAADDDHALVDRVRRGDATAYDTLVRRHIRRATIIARRLLGNVEDAEDLVQEAFVRALNRISSFDNSRAFAPWFFRLLINAGINARKARALRVAEPEHSELPS